MSLRLFIVPVVLTLLVWQGSRAADKGVLPRGADGKALNLDFETGDLRHWLASGEAFKGQPIKGDTVHRRRRDMRSNHAGQFWVGTYERQQDTPQGTLTSAPFKVTHPFAAFLVGGGPHATTCVELVRRDTGKVFFHVSGKQRENMHRVVVDLKEQMGKEIYIRLLDRHSGGWGHINFDDFKLYAAKPSSALVTRPRRVVDLFPHKGLSPEKAAQAMTLPKGFKVIACAGEPDVRQPIAMTLDDRGRVWIAEAYSYPTKQPKNKGRDRILIFEDTDGNGTLDKRKVFIDKLNLVSGLEVGFGGVWVGQAPHLLFIPDKNGDDKPDAPPQVVLDGWGYHDTHETLNSFIWGPDGWLYGCHGVFTHSLVGKPGTPKDKRTPINAGIWRYHPTREQFEVFAHGTSNPWGIDFNDHGDAFLTCCVIPHLFHVIPGARYHRQAGRHFQPHTYADIQTIARHRHFVGNQWSDADRARSAASGGGHAHAGAMIYLGNAWPSKYRGQLFMNNIHGARLNVDRLTPRGSGYVGDGEPDFCKTNDLHSQILYLRYGPDGQVYMIDWYDRNQCHHKNQAGHDRSNGRIYKIIYKDSPEQKATRVDLRTKTDAELVQLQLHRNDWYVRHARRLLQERASADKWTPGRLSPPAPPRLDAKVRPALEKLAFTHTDVTRRLRGLWALHVTGGLTAEHIARGLKNDSPHVRSWTIRLACETGQPSPTTVKTLVTLAEKDKSQVVRRALASALPRIPLAGRWDILAPLLTHPEDASDHNLPLMYWYAFEPMVQDNPPRALELASGSKVPLLLTFTIRRIASGGNAQSLELLIQQLKATSTPAVQLQFLQGIQTALVGRRKVAMPSSWKGVYTKLSSSSNAQVRTLARSLAVTFGDPAALVRMRELLMDRKTPLEERQQFLATLRAAGDSQLVPTLHRLLAEPEMRQAALRALGSYDDPGTPRQILAMYKRFDAQEKRDALATLCGRASYARALLAAVGAKKIPATDLTAEFITQLRNLGDRQVNEQIGKVWGVVRRTAADKARLITHYKRLIEAHKPGPRDLALGRSVFARTCQQCHTLFGVGGQVGPDLTGANRADLDYLLSNIIDPSAVMGKDYVSRVIITTRGRVLTGLIQSENRTAVTLITQNETVVIPRKEIETIRESGKSMMPEDLLKPLKDREVQALAAYLASPRQVPLLATPENTKGFFNGRDLTGWRMLGGASKSSTWKVEDGVLVGSHPGSKRESYLVSELLLEDFRLSFLVKVTGDKGSAGIFLRGELLADGSLKGYHFILGGKNKGALREEKGRGLLARASTSPRTGAWVRCELEAVGNRIQIMVDGKRCMTLEDPPGRPRGILGFQLSGDTTQLHIKDIKLELEGHGSRIEK